MLIEMSVFCFENLAETLRGSQFSDYRQDSKLLLT